MARTTAQQTARQYTQEFLPEGERGPLMRLDLTKRRSFLDIDRGEVSDLAGVDVTKPWRRADPRRSVGTSLLGYVDRPAVDVLESEFDGNGLWSLMARMGQNSVYNFTLVNASTLRIGSDLYDWMLGGVGWPSFLPDGGVLIYYDADSTIRPYAAAYAPIVAVSSNTRSNDTLHLERPLKLAGSDIVGAAGDFFRLEHVAHYDRRGIVVSTGRKFFLFQAASYGSAALLSVPAAGSASRWRGARISNSRFLLVSDRHPPHILNLAGQRSIVPLVGATATLNATGLVVNSGTAFVEYTWSAGDRAILSNVVGGAIAGSYLIASRDSDSQITLKSSAGTTGTMALRIERVATETLALAGPIPPFAAPRPQTGPGYREPHPSMVRVAGQGGAVTAGLAGVRLRILDLDTNALSGMHQVCSQIAPDFSPLMATTAGDVIDVYLRTNTTLTALHDRGHILQVFRKLSAGSSYFLEQEIPLASLKLRGQAATPDVVVRLTLSDDDLQRKRPMLFEGDVLKGVPPAGRDVAVLGDSGIVLIAGRADADNFQPPVIDTVEYDWPMVDNDNVVHFSRADAFEPENFPPTIGNQLVLSRIGDTFQRFAAAGSAVIAVMAQGVYRLQSGGALGVSRHVIAETGLGTPWPDSVIGMEGRAVWANANNVYVYEPPSEERSESLSTLGDAISAWLAEAFDLGDNVQSYFDPRRRVLILRRVKASGTFQDWEYCLNTSASSFVEDRTGVAFAPAMYAESPAKEQPVLYSIDQAGAVFEVGRQARAGDTHPYDGATVQAVLDGGYTITAQSIAKAGVFSARMIGDSIRFRSANGAVNGQVRRILDVRNHGVAASLGYAIDNLTTLALRNDRGVLAYVRVSTGKLEARLYDLASDGTPSFSAPLIIESTINAATDIVPIADDEVWIVGRASSNRVTVYKVLVRESLLELVTMTSNEVFNAGGTSNVGSAARIATRKAVVAFTDSSQANATTLRTVSESSGAFVQGPVLTTGNTPAAQRVLRLADGVAVLGVDNGGAGVGKLSLLTVTGDTITIPNSYTFAGAGPNPLAMASIDAAAFVMAYQEPGVGGRLRAHSVAGTVITLGTAVTFHAATVSDLAVVMLSAGKGIVGYRKAADNTLWVTAFNRSGNTITLGQSAQVTANGTDCGLSAIDASHFVVTYEDAAAALGKIVTGVVYGASDTVSVSAVNLSGPDTLLFDAVPGLAAGDEFMIGAVPLRCRFAPVWGERRRNMKRLDGLSVWARPDGRTVTTAKKMRIRAYRNLSSSAAILNTAAATEVEVAIKAPSEADATDEAMHADVQVEGKAIEVELSNEDADLGLELVHVAGIVTERGELAEDRSSTG